MLELRTPWSKGLAYLIMIMIVIPFGAPLAAVLLGANGGDGIIANIRTVALIGEVPRYFGGSLIVAAGTVALSLVASLPCAYALARLRHLGKTAIQMIMVTALALPSVSIIVPLVYVVSVLKISNSYLAIIVPLVALGLPFNIILARSFLQALPGDVFEAASLDGCGSFRMFIHIAVPMSRPVVGVLIVWTFVGAWNEFLLPLVFLLNPAHGVVTLLPLFFQSEYSGNMPLIVTASLFGLVPSVIMFLATQRMFAQGLSAGMLR